MPVERDQSVERLLRQSAGGVPPGDSCIDAETLAAWLDGGLTAREVALVESHAAGCARCQALAAAFVKLPATATPDKPRSRVWHLGWLVPLTAGAAAAAVWFALPNTRAPEDVFRAQRQATEARATVSSGSPEAKDAAPASPASEPAAGGGAPQPSGSAIGSMARSELAKRELSNQLESADARRDEQPQFAPAPPAAAPKEVESGRASTDALAGLAETTGGLAETTGRLADRTEKAAAAPAAAPPPPVAEARPTASAAAPTQARAMATTRARQSAAEILSPNPSIRWRTGVTGSIEYSSNAGASWESLRSGTTTDLVAGASPSPAVCWIVGRAGTVLLTTDGRTWRRLGFPTTADLVSVQATDARTATVTTSDGRTLRTVDAGATWN